MTHETERRVVAFVRTMAGACSICLRKADGQCGDCPSAWANRIMREIRDDARPTPQVDYSFYGRTSRILAVLRKAGRPLLAREIDLRGLCSAQLKCWTLNQMVRNGTLCKQFAYTAQSRGRQKPFFTYSLNTKKGKPK